MRGKLIWKSLKTNRVSVAKLRLGDFHKVERQRAAAKTAVSRDKMTFADALQTYRDRLMGDQSLKDRSKAYRRERITLFTANKTVISAARAQNKFKQR